MFSCNLPSALLAEWPGSFMCSCDNMGVERIPRWVSTERWPWRGKFSCHSCRDSNPQPFNHQAGALTTELSLLPIHNCDLDQTSTRSLTSSSLQMCHLFAMMLTTLVLTVFICQKWHQMAYNRMWATFSPTLKPSGAQLISFTGTAS